MVNGEAVTAARLMPRGQRRSGVSWFSDIGFWALVTASAPPVVGSSLLGQRPMTETQSPRPGVRAAPLDRELVHLFP